MDRIQILYTAVRQAILDYEESLESLKGIVLSNDGKGDNRYRLSALTTFERALVEKIVVNYLRISNSGDETVGWEVNYPRNLRRQKLDLAVGLVDEKQNLFETVVEVKKWRPQIDTVPYSIWKDIFRLCWYFSTSNPKVGQNRFMLLLFDTKDMLSDLNAISKTFINFEYLTAMKNDPRVKKKFSSRYSGKDLDNDYWFFHYFLSVELNLPTGIEVALRTLGIQDKTKPFLEMPLKTRDSDGLISGRRTSATVLKLLC